jgi:hypothetical protein
MRLAADGERLEYGVGELDGVHGRPKIRDPVDVRSRVERGIEDERVMASAAGEHVVTGAADQDVVTGAARESVIAGAALQSVVPLVPDQPIGSAATRRVLDDGAVGDSEVVLPPSEEKVPSFRLMLTAVLRPAPLIVSLPPASQIVGGRRCRA